MERDEEKWKGGCKGGDKKGGWNGLREVISG